MLKSFKAGTKCSSMHDFCKIKDQQSYLLLLQVSYWVLKYHRKSILCFHLPYEQDMKNIFWAINVVWSHSLHLVDYSVLSKITFAGLSNVASYGHEALHKPLAILRKHNVTHIKLQSYYRCQHAEGEEQNYQKVSANKWTAFLD